MATQSLSDPAGDSFYHPTPVDKVLAPVRSNHGAATVLSNDDTLCLTW